MKTVHKRRLLKLARFLDKLQPRKFRFSSVIAERDKNNCGTVCCAIGWTPAVFPTLIKWDNRNLSWLGYRTIASELFGIPAYEASQWFGPSDSGLGGAAKPKEVAAHIRKLVSQSAD